MTDSTGERSAHEVIYKSNKTDNSSTSYRRQLQLRRVKWLDILSQGYA